MFALLRIIFIGLFFSLSLFLTQCSKSGESHLQVNQALATPFKLPASAYLALAKHQEGDEQKNLLLMAAGRYIYDGQWQQGQTILTQIGEMQAIAHDEKIILFAKIDLLRGIPKAVVDNLSKVKSLAGLPLFYQSQYHELLAYAYQSLGNLSDAVNERIKLEGILPDEASRANNRRVLWLSLTTLPLVELNTLAMEAPPHSMLQGWMTLALIARQSSVGAEQLYDQVYHWQTQFPHHPANSILPTPLEAIKSYLMPRPHQIGVLLPLTGGLAGPGGAIRDGILKAHLDNPIKDVSLRFYNTASESAATLYDKAIQEGADYVIGPLTKSDVASVFSKTHPVPTLFLNELSGQANNNAYQFGLSPASEARQVAARARKDGHAKALIIAPVGVWGDDIIAAFQQQWQQNGGIVVDVYRFNDSDKLNNTIKEVLHASAVKRATINKKGEKVIATPERRHDIDMIFLLAYPTKARQIMPMLKYYYAGDIPVYATSAVYGGNADSMQDKDLDGIIFCDMPWVFNTQMGSRHWPEQLNSYNRLFALGYDSYMLARQLNQLLIFPAMGVSEASGVLYLSHGQKISRILEWGQFRQGIAKPLRPGN